jgi:REP element-mobilizing transposase RayT
MDAWRKNLRLRGYDYSRPGVYFITICTAEGEPLFGEIRSGQMIRNDAGNVLAEIWAHLPQRFPNIALDAFVVMPNHVHGVVVFDKPGINQKQGAASSAPTTVVALGRVVRSFKSESAIRVNAILKTSGRFVWQRNYFEHIVRTGKDLDEIRQYIHDNPLRWDSDPENARP